MGRRYERAHQIQKLESCTHIFGDYPILVEIAQIEGEERFRIIIILTE